MNAKTRLSASVDADLVAAAEMAVAEGRSSSVSAWVNDALRLKLEHEGRLRALGAFVDAFEREHGVLTPRELEAAARRARVGAVVVRPASARAGKRSTRRRAPA